MAKTIEDELCIIMGDIDSALDHLNNPKKRLIARAELVKARDRLIKLSKVPRFHTEEYDG